MNARVRGSTIVPTIRYRDVPAAIAWLGATFGFEPHRLVKGDDGAVRYAELTFGSGMVMVGPIEEDALGRLMVQPSDIGGVETQICYLFIEDVQAHRDRAQAAGADIVLDIEDEANGGRGYSCRDPEGHVWNFGTYDPWVRQPAVPVRELRTRGGRRRAVAVIGLVALLAGALFLYEPARAALGEIGANVLVRIAAAEGQETDALATASDEVALRDWQEQLTRAKLAKSASERTAKDLREQLVLEQRQREAAELAAAQARDQLAGLHTARAKAATHAAEARSQLEQVRVAKEAAEQSAKEARGQLEQARADREAAEKAREARAIALRERRARILEARVAARQKAAIANFPPRVMP